MTEAELRDGVDALRVGDAGSQRVHRLVDERHQDAVRDEAGHVARLDRLLAEVARERDDRGGRVVRGRLGADHLDEPQHRHRVEEVHPDHAVGPVRRPGEPPDRDRARVRGENRARRQRRVRFAEHVLLDRRVLHDRLDQQVGIGRVGERSDLLDPSENVRGLRAALLGKLAQAAPHRLERSLDRAGLRIDERDAPAGGGDDLGDPAAHLPRADDDDLADLHAAREPALRLMSDGRHRVVVVGGGFRGLQAVARLRRLPVDVTLVDRRNFHLFQPLTYQVASGALSPGEIAYPLRSIFKRSDNVHVLLADVADFDLERRELRLRPVAGVPAPDTLAYDTLIVGGGSRYSYFGHDEWREHAAEVKSLESALVVRSRLLAALEAAEVERDEQRRRAWLTFVVVGAGPTGVEMAGQIAELTRDTVRREYRAADTRSA